MAAQAQTDDEARAPDPFTEARDRLIDALQRWEGDHRVVSMRVERAMAELDRVTGGALTLWGLHRAVAVMRDWRPDV